MSQQNWLLIPHFVQYMDCIEYQLAPILYRPVFIHNVINGCYQLLYSESRRKAITGLTYFSQSPEQRKETRDSWSTLDVIASLIVLAACIAFYIYFW